MQNAKKIVLIAGTKKQALPNTSQHSRTATGVAYWSTATAVLYRTKTHTESVQKQKQVVRSRPMAG
eukprot:6179213-Pleurochrysis_carterae.AAC.2